MHVHVVFVTKYRHPVFTAQHLEPMEQIMRDVCADFGAELAEFNGEAEHVHLLVNFPPTVAISRLVNSHKGVSSRRLRQEFPGLHRHHWRAKRLWSGSYFAGSVGGAPLSVLHHYIEQQQRPPTGSRPAACTTGPKAGALAATLVAREEGHQMRQLALIVLGALVALAGAVWTLQGLGYIGGSFMSGATLWAVIGPIVLLAGLAIIYFALRGRRRSR
jgi:REP-associated tyrosine transposase